MQFAAAEPFPNRTRLRLRFRRHRRQGIDPKFFDSWSRNGVRVHHARGLPMSVLAAKEAACMASRQKRARRPLAKMVLRLPDLEQSKNAVVEFVGGAELPRIVPPRDG